ncbi:hypothetical protein BAUCODRAFT_288601 [Baudoinia panamericana UAMH 10762]|uniref:Uncharacterized protein n=1 Tax=Baudoinia panamericana (strain UAMH 10762) TaxID=717646 RepID=M2M7W8_BAUPA|nr:uncharacterized protein BAUCODRAFT_288601 [Baudoinia panamericana UAMH 10762]EMC92426.1 hypothetical protein BAUCODRAFT_288601 [Baudoinia panamericana UAMH 10762]
MPSPLCQPGSHENRGACFHDFILLRHFVYLLIVSIPKPIHAIVCGSHHLHRLGTRVRDRPNSGPHSARRANCAAHLRRRGAHQPPRQLPSAARYQICHPEAVAGKRVVLLVDVDTHWHHHSVWWPLFWAGGRRGRQGRADERGGARSVPALNSV